MRVVTVSSFVAIVGFAIGCGAPQRVDPEVDRMTRDVKSENCQRSVETLAGFGTRNTMSETTGETRGIGAARRWIEAEFRKISAESGGRLVVETDSYVQQPDRNRITKPTEIVNVVATLPGTQPESRERIYVVSGHYDSMCSDPKDFNCDAPGADDDASGVAVVLECARVMSRHSFDATIVFMAVAGEEQGLLGSKHWASVAKQNGKNIAGMFTNDIVGASRGPSGVDHSRRVRVFSEGVPTSQTAEQARMRVATGNESDSVSRQLARFVDESTATYVAGFDAELIFRRDRYLRGGDHISFLEQGYPAVRFTEYEENFDHQHQTPRNEDGREMGDWPKYCDYAYIANVARANLAALAALARGPAAPRNARIITAKLTNQTTLRWDKSVEPDVVGYEVVWRETTAPDWQHSKSFGNVTEATLPISKDNAFFGLRAVDASGHRSVVAAPMPARE